MATQQPHHVIAIRFVLFALPSTPHGGPRAISNSKAGKLASVLDSSAETFKFATAAVAARQTWKRSRVDAEVQKEPIGGSV
jgi:hypothetical protein